MAEDLSSLAEDAEDDTRSRITRYRELVLRYESIHHDITQLLHQYQGGTEHMVDADRQRYREMAHQRDELVNEIRMLEQQLMDEDT